MMIIAQKDCNNSPKKNIIYLIHVHYASENYEEFGKYVTSDYEMEIIARETVFGWENVKSHLEKQEQRPKKLIITQIISHGKYGAAHGKYVYEDYEVAFSNYYEFSSVASKLVKKTTSYLVAITR